MKTIGKFKIDIYTKEGKLRDSTGWIKNLTTNTGKAAFAGLVGNTGSITAFTYLAVGTSNTAVAASQTALSAEIVDAGLERASATISRVTTTVTNDTLVFTKTFTATATRVIEEVGYFNASSSGIMGGRALTTTKTVNNTEQIVVTYNVQFT
jgi:hypothetical protein